MICYPQVKQSEELLSEGLKQEGLLARDFEFAFYKKVGAGRQSDCSLIQPS